MRARQLALTDARIRRTHQRMGENAPPTRRRCCLESARFTHRHTPARTANPPRFPSRDPDLSLEISVAEHVGVLIRGEHLAVATEVVRATCWRCRDDEGATVCSGDEEGATVSAAAMTRARPCAAAMTRARPREQRRRRCAAAMMTAAATSTCIATTTMRGDDDDDDAR